MPSSGIREYNFDGLVGPTHNYAGLSYGNVASMCHAKKVSNPRKAALQGLSKMKLLADFGVGQAVLPPQPRPDVETLRRLGFSGTHESILKKAFDKAPRLLSGVSSSSSMWAANAATVSPSANTGDRRVHLTVANLVANFHRSIEAENTHRVLKAVFNDENHFNVHRPLPATVMLADEGAANHMLMSGPSSNACVEIFVYGRDGMGTNEGMHSGFPKRQTLETSMAISRLHQLDPEHTIFIKQNPKAVDKGVFHNDVISVANGNVLLAHEDAFEGGKAALSSIVELYEKVTGSKAYLVSVSPKEVSVETSVSTYLFNSQLVTLQKGKMLLLAPEECKEDPQVANCIEKIIELPNPIQEVRYVQVRESMQNGGGPACLRLKVVLTENEANAVTKGVIFTDELHERLIIWVKSHYRDRLSFNDLADPNLLTECYSAIDELTNILGLGALYPFQKG